MHSYAVLQAGARMHYAVPTLLARAGALAAFYTDFHANHRAVQLLGSLIPSSLQPKQLKRLLGRRLPAELARANVRDQLLASLTWAQNGNQRDALVIARARKENFGAATAVYTNFINNDLSAIRHAKELGLHVVHEMITPPVIGRIASQEYERFPGVETKFDSPEEVEAGIQRDIEKWSLSDQVLVPSQFCLESATSLGCDYQKINIVPYGISEDWLEICSAPEGGRILSVGRPSLLKGTHVLAEAYRLLRTRGISCECRIAGPPLVDISNVLFSGPTYLGQVPRGRIREEFRRADLFVLPTLADSFALVHLEAMACGIPVITTPNCGSLVRDGVEGFIVPIRDSQALAERIAELLNDRDLRRRMGEAARKRASAYTWMRYGERLLEVLP